MRVALLFIDGVGVGRRDPDVNPLARGDYLLSHFDDGTRAALPDGGAFAAVDTTFGVPGRPQSASNQTAILTGLPAPRMIGKHVLGYPNPALRKILGEHSIARRLRAHDKRSSFVNAYPAGYLDALGLPRRHSEKPDVVIPPNALRRLRPSATTVAMSAADVLLRTLDDARRGEALTNDIDGRRARERGFQIPRRDPEEAAEIFWRIFGETDFLLFEHYLADEAGHAQDHAAAQEALGTFDRFARAVVLNRPDDAYVLVCSDHGNVEDLSTRSHTLNPVPVLTFGPDAALVADAVRDVADVGRTVLRLLGAPAPEHAE